MREVENNTNGEDNTGEEEMHRHWPNPDNDDNVQPSISDDVAMHKASSELGRPMEYQSGEKPSTCLRIFKKIGTHIQHLQHQQHLSEYVGLLKQC